MTSALRRYGTATHKPTVGDTKTSLVTDDHMGWLLCDGRALFASAYSQLYNVLGNSFGGSPDGTVFNLPNPQGRVLAFAGQPQDLSGNYASGAIWRETAGTNAWNVGDLSGNQATIGTSGIGVVASANPLQPTVWVGNMFIYSGKMYGGTDGLIAPYSTNLFPNTDFITNPIVGAPRTFPAGNRRPVY